MVEFSAVSPRPAVCNWVVFIELWHLFFTKVKNCITNFQYAGSQTERKRTVLGLLVLVGGSFSTDVVSSHYLLILQPGLFKHGVFAEITAHCQLLYHINSLIMIIITHLNYWCVVYVIFCSIKSVALAASHRLNFLCRWCAGGCSPCPRGSAPALAGRARASSGCSSGVSGSRTRSRRSYSPWCEQASVIIQTRCCVFSLLLAALFALLQERKNGAVTRTARPGAD